MRLVLIVALLVFLSSCVAVKESFDEENLRFVVLAYRYGYNLDEEELSQIAKNTSYDDEVLAYYEYFKTGNLPKGVETRAAEIYDQRILDILKESLPIDGTSTPAIVDAFDEHVPKSEWDPQIDRIDQNLLERVHTLLLNDWRIKGFFYSWCEKYSIAVKEEDLESYAQFLVRACEASSKVVLKKTSHVSSSFFTDEVDLSLVPTELVLAICYVESKFFPGAFRCEIRNETVEAVSAGLGQILADADSLTTQQDIGDGEKELYTFELLNVHYFENLFNVTDLTQVKAGVFFSRTLLALLMQKFR
ncbi:MAG: Uncharacterized protein XD58_1492 [Thermotoga sp. 50_1627]|uniref:hypothetical protein n=1 Tax=Pseudothermotoga sp. TaxID=2033661 RepID=UPI00076DCA1F|nr:MAG: Uncharacterized protein XD45_1315 [Thermotoga sp. 50_64]KUK24528.1 MAG: Uncharacterized protein XD58_1492 [Thermotoga sp. 50_1627]MBC7117291.1 hypothetical protein [Pseudothermotoga sp.]MDK2923249.1 hypothetical protein [Pseudothermotoga sp.]HBT39213.1 hypothetical protein [Pseudothermotoga sp.]